MIVPTNFKKTSKFFIGAINENNLRGKNDKSLHFFTPARNSGWEIAADSIVAVSNKTAGESVKINLNGINIDFNLQQREMTVPQ
jgi:hypothetical protein